ncbi:unnamed protein product [Allacma fusca]|uniref:ER-bound oxygenase mpaB/mpaB'/Rubber oxygenase catalytic domain-containing protein n=1 Tax=Allacma fusca TaxID=39272 RepID=A0A8J2KJM3_9HEXA|nr:unnamed protein product [Allacma fusca]
MEIGPLVKKRRICTLAIGIGTTTRKYSGTSNRMANDIIPVTKVLEIGVETYGDTKSPSTFPCWFDLDLARAGQKFASKYFGHVLFANSLSSIVLLSDRQVREALLLARDTFAPGKNAKTYIATAQQILLWYQSDILSTEWSMSLKNVREIHLSVSKRLKEKDTSSGRKAALEDNSVFRSKTNTKMWEAFRMDIRKLDTPETRQKFVPSNSISPRFRFNQYAMSIALWSFVALPVLKPDQLGISKFSEEDLQGFAHLWATIAYTLGMDERFIFCKNTVAQWTECKEYLKDLFTAYYLPQLLELDFQGEILIENQFHGVQELTPGISDDAWLINLLENHLGVRATHLRRQQNLPSILFGSTANWFATDATRISPSLQRIYYRLVSSIFKSSSIKHFGDPGTNATIVASRHFSWEREL